MKVLATPDKILDAAELLFAEHGIGSTSLRSIVSEADVNIAAVNYHFGSKDELIKAVFRRRLQEVNAKRMDLLEALRKKYPAKAIPVEDLLNAFLTPPLELSRSGGGKGDAFFRLVHAETDKVVQDELFEQLKDIVQVFLAELGKSLPHLSEQERAIRLAFVAGAMVQTALLPLKPLFVSKLFPNLSSEQVFEMLVRFCRDGMQAEGTLS